MHVGFITSHFPFRNDKSVGGIGTSIKSLSDELQRLGHKVTVFVYGQIKDERIEGKNFTVLKIKNVKVKGFSWYLTRKKIQRKILKESTFSKIDIVETPDWEGISSFINLDCPIVIRLHGSDTYFCHLDYRPVKWINKFHEKRALQKADSCISVSQYTADMTNQLFGLNKNFKIIPNGINTELFFKTEKVDTVEVQDNLVSKDILYFGGIIRKKGLLEIPHYFNRIIKVIPDARLVLIGKDMSDGLTLNPSTYNLMNELFSEEAKLRVSFLGSVPHHQIKQNIEKAAVCIFPSYAEALPVSWLEAMALEKAVVVSDIGWSNEIIDEGIDGFKVNPKNYDQFAETILKLLNNAELRKNIGENARIKIIEKFSSEITAQKAIQFYNETIINQNTEK